MKVLVIPEDATNDRHVLTPLFERLFETLDAKRPGKTKVVVCANPVLRGVNEALKEANLRKIVDRYRDYDLFVLCVDRDGDLRRRARLDRLENRFEDKVAFLAVEAWKEVETWVLAGLRLPRDWAWADVRAEIHLKERYFEEFARREGLSDAPFGGRKELARRAAARLSGIIRKCPEDFGRLRDRLAATA